jgi:pimeloyl-ACP methyl ester carboxylesterase
MSAIIKFIGASLNGISYISPSYASKKALNLFSTPRKGQITEDQLPLLQTAFKNEITRDQISVVTYRWIGKGPTVLLAHGWESNAARWEFLIKALKKQDYNVVALDAPAHGNSNGKQFNAILYSEYINIVVQKFEPQIIIGHSVGGMASVFFQHKYQFKGLQKIVLLGAPSHFVGVFKRYTEMLGYNDKIVKGLDALVVKLFNKPPSHFSAAKFSEEIKIKGLIIHDKKDEIIPFEDALLFKEHYKNAELYATTGYGHTLKSPEITKKVLEFISS